MPRLFEQDEITNPLLVAISKRLGIGSAGSPTENITLETLGKVLGAYPAWTEPTLNAGFVTNADNPIKYRINMFGQLEIKGIFANSGAGAIAFTLPTPPDIILGGLIGVPFLDISTIGMCGINSVGELYAFNTGTQFNNSYNSFAAIVPYLDLTT